MSWISKCMKLFCIFILSLTLAVALNPGERASAFTDQVIQKGSTGLDVVELQARLQYIGYYRGSIDGVFGWNTYWALRKFQKKFGLEVDGLAGLETRQKLVSVTKYDEQWVREQIRKGVEFTYYGGTPKKIQTKHPKSGGPSNNQGAPRPQANQGGRGGQGGQAPGQVQNGQLVREAENVPEGFSQSDIELMTHMVFAEAKGEPYIGKVAVAAVILNRVNSPKFPNTVSGVIYEPQAFTSVAQGTLWAGKPGKESKKAVLDALNGTDPSGGALYYFNPAKATSDWIWSRPQIKKIGEHIFTN
ncbi:MAG TPA: spore cortex-lytic enzyme [Bacillales bacterium]|nr:spore cortex-lytic enzyme [Bacillales bacterium]